MLNALTMSRAPFASAPSFVTPDAFCGISSHRALAPRLAAGSSDNPKCQLRRIVACRHIRLADPLKSVPKSLTDGHLCVCHICQHHPATPSSRPPRVNQASRHEHVSTPEVEARGEPGDLVMRPTAPLHTVISVPVKDPVAGPRQPSGKLDRRLT